MALDRLNQQYFLSTVMIQRHCTHCVFAIAALLWCSCAAALNPNLTIKQLLHTAWGPRDGAPLGGVQALAQTDDGFLWLASTDGGLYRFDGITFEHVELPHDAKLASTDVRGIFAPRSGGLWVSVFSSASQCKGCPSGVAFRREGSWHVYGADDGLPPGSVIEFAETPDGTLWVATSEGFGRFDGVRWKSAGADMGLPVGVAPVFVFVDGQGTVWLGASGQMFTLRAGERQFKRSSYSGPMAAIARLTESSTGAIWYDTVDSLSNIHQNPAPVIPSSPSGRGPAFDHDGTLWDIFYGIVRINPERLRSGGVVPLKGAPDRYTPTDGLTGEIASALMIDREGSVWVGTDRGLDRFAEPSLEAPLRDERNRTALGSVSEIGLAPADHAGGLWVSDTYAAVQRYQDGQLATPALKERITCLFRSDDGSVWFGGRKTLWRERLGHFESLTPPGADGDTQALAVDKSGGLWASIARSSVFYLKDSVWTPYGGIATLPRRWAITIVRDRRDRLWFSYPDGTVAVLDGDRVRTYGAAEGLRIGLVTANYSGRTDQWLGGESGLARFDGERFHTVSTASGLSLVRITGIVETAAGDLWLNGQSGIVHLPAAELRRSRLDPSYQVKGEAFGAFDGVVGTGWIRRPLPTAIEAGNGKLWFATSSAFFGVDPNRLVLNRVPPPVVIRALTAGDLRIEPSPGLTLPVRTTAVRFDYAGLSLTEAQKVRFRYRLDGIDSDWREVTAAREVLYSNLRPGHYTFRVIAANNDGVWNEKGAVFDFTIPAAFVQTGWFIALCLAGGAFAIWGLVRLRVHQATDRVHRRLGERMAERERIARDLHDTLLQGVQGLMLRFQVAAERIPKGEPTREMLDRALERADQVVDEGRARVKGLRAPVGGVPRLPQALARIAEELAPADASPFRITVEGPVRELDPIVREEVQSLTREALANAYHHANAGKIEAEISYGEDALTVRIRDDGQGIDGELLRKGRAGHYGLVGMRERAEKIRARLGIWSKPGAGTEVDLRVPAAIAYRQSAPRSWRRPWWRRKASLPDIEDANL